MTGLSDNSKWNLENHTQRKHRVLSYYLSIWSKILGEHFANLIYWDFYSGRGDYSNGEPGSPLIAMEISEECYIKGNSKKRPINLHCVFIERDNECHDYLQGLLRDLYPGDEGKRWFLFRGECTQIYKKLTTSEANPIFTKKIPRFFLIDPYGPPIPLEVLRRIMGLKYTECLITFMTEFINRYASDAQQELNLKGVFGVGDLVELRSICDNDEPYAKIVDYYRQRLMDPKGGNIRFVTQPFEMRPDRRDVPLYYLLGCTNNDLGLRKMHEAMRAVSENPDFSYKGKLEGFVTLDYFDDPIPEIAEWIFQNIRQPISTMDLIYGQCCAEKTWSRSQVIKAIRRLEDERKVIIKPRGRRKRRGRSVSDHLICFQRDESFYDS